MRTELVNDVVLHHQMYGEPEAIALLAIKGPSLSCLLLWSDFADALAAEGY